MKNLIIKSSVTLGLAFALALSVKADPITGSINFGGNDTTDVGAGTVTFGPATINGASGTFTQISGNYTATISSFGLYTTPGNSTAPAGDVLWTVDDNAVGGDDYTFTISSISLLGNTGNTYYAWTGQGTFDIAGPTGSYVDTVGSWTISTSSNDGGATFSFESSNGTSVPDSGATALLVGLGVVAMGAYGLRRKLVRA